MKFNENTISILKNFSSINPSIMLRKGNIIKTGSSDRAVMASAIIDDEIESDAGIYNISQFLSALSLFDEPDIAFDENFFVISDKNRSINYVYAAENLILSPKKDKMVISNKIAEFDLSWAELKNLVNASSVLQLPDIRFSSVGNNVIDISTINRKNPTANVYNVKVAMAEGYGDFDSVEISTTYLKLIQADYHVTIGNGMIEFQSPKVTYWFAIQADQKK